MSYRGVDKREVFWACGRGILVSQWFTNGTLGVSWLPGLSDLGGLVGVGQVVVYGVYSLALVAIAALFARAAWDPARWRRALAASIGLIAVGDALLMLVGLELAPRTAYIAGMAAVGAGLALPMAGWGVWCCAVGARRACLGVAASFVSGAALLGLVSAAGSVSAWLGAVLQIALLPLSHLFLVRSLEPFEGSRVWSRAPLDLRACMPFLATVAVLGFVFGVVVGISDAGPAGGIMPWALGTAVVACSAFAITARARDFDLGVMSRALVPLLVVCLFLMPGLTDSIPELVGAIGCGGYAFSMIFCCSAYAGISHDCDMPAVPLACAATVADSAGILAGVAACAALNAAGPLPFQITGIATLLAVVTVALGGSLLLRDRSIASLWGLRQPPSELDVVRQRCAALGERAGLTTRETEVMTLLSQGLDPFDVSRELGISVATVRTHARSVYAKADVHSQTELMRRVLMGAPEPDGETGRRS